MSATALSRTLPVYHSSLVGREGDIQRLRDLLRDPEISLITITGTSGVGKTRLATTAGQQLLDRQDIDVLFIPLATTLDPTLVPGEIGKALNIQGEQLAIAIRSRLDDFRGLVILDNFEQLIEAAPFVSEIRPGNPDVTILVTSQRPLQVEGERVLRLDPLPVPEPDNADTEISDNPSVQLVIERAASQDDSIVETLESPETSETLAEICRRLDGIPLALELAASRLATLSPEVVLTQLESGHGILSSQRKDRPERQRTIHTAIAWSFQLLPEEIQQVFLRLAPFAAGFGLDIVKRLVTHLKLTA